jgi:4-hydroxythreonine-4-phosphate dehydrogenase
MGEKPTGGRFRPRVAISIGDINGIGPEVVLKCLSDRRIYRFFSPVVVGSAAALEAHAGLLGLKKIAIRKTADLEEIDDQNDHVVWVLDEFPDEEPPIRIGQITEAAGRVAMAAITRATDLCIDGRVHAMVTAPISKEAVARAGFNVPGHTEFIASRCNSPSFTMMMLADSLRVGLVTGHVPVSVIPELVTGEKILEKADIILSSLHGDFGVERPRLAVLGLNPHAGDGGVIGEEEDRIIRPAIEDARKADKLVFGPFPADGFFASRKFNAYDAVLAMYHDQGLAPFKVLSFNSGINFTAGLPIVRTSPDHGTAFDIAGEGKASPDSMRNALYAAIDIARRRRADAGRQQAA